MELKNGSKNHTQPFECSQIPLFLAKERKLNVMRMNVKWIMFERWDFPSSPFHCGVHEVKSTPIIHFSSSPTRALAC
jgi:hypothetical protein